MPSIWKRLFGLLYSNNKLPECYSAIFVRVQILSFYPAIRSHPSWKKAARSKKKVIKLQRELLKSRKMGTEKFLRQIKHPSSKSIIAILVSMKVFRRSWNDDDHKDFYLLSVYLIRWQIKLPQLWRVLKKLSQHSEPFWMWISNNLQR